MNWLDYYDDGFQAGLDGKPLSDNPCPDYKNKINYYGWRIGWETATVTTRNELDYWDHFIAGYISGRYGESLYAQPEKHVDEDNGWLRGWAQAQNFEYVEDESKEYNDGRRAFLAGLDHSENPHSTRWFHILIKPKPYRDWRTGWWNENEWKRWYHNFYLYHSIWLTKDPERRPR